MAMNPTFSYNLRRARLARLGLKLSGWRERLLLAFGWLLLLSGMALLLLDEPLGWLVAGLAFSSFALRRWVRDYLQKIPAAQSPQEIGDVLTVEILSRLPGDPSPYDVATAVGQVSGGHFFAARFGLTPVLLQELSSHDPRETVGLWQTADALRQQAGLDTLNAGILIAALLQLAPEHEGLLAQMHLDFNDLLKGEAWLRHINELINHAKKPRLTGGIARDWSFGYVPLLTRFGQNISEQIARGGRIGTELETHRQALDRLIDTFSHEGVQNAALVGPAGVGKTTVIHAFAERLLDGGANLPDNLKFRQVFMLDSSSLLAAAPGRGELEQLVMQVLGEAYSAKNIIICLDNAELFFSEGVGSVDLTNVLLPILEAGRLRLILSLDEQRLLQIGQRNPGLVNAINRINVSPTGFDETMLVLEDHLILTEFERKVTFTYQSLKEAYRLSERYIYDLAMPGRAIKLLDSAAAYAENGLVTMNSVQNAIEQTLDVKVGVADNAAERSKLLNLEDLIHQRMIDQSRAVQVVSDALRRARAGVRNESRPIGTFLFLGPTGVGKTELAKALAATYFDGEDKIIRLDLNEYVSPNDVGRLIADGADNPMSLTAQVMKQPFSVILLDEIEKAHPNVLTTLLQALDEGILRDIKNRDISFRDAIVIATSNAGAERIREYIERGYQLDQFEQQFIDELISSGQFRPEFLNRFDEIVLFRPLGKEELMQVLDLMVTGVNKTLALQHISVTVDDDAKTLLVEAGYDPRLGARPMRRIVQRTVENLVAKQMLAGAVAPGGVIRISRQQVAAIVDITSQADAIAASS